MSPTGMIVLRVVAVGMIGIGLVGLYGAARMRLKAAQAHRWPTVKGTIVSSELEEKSSRHDGKRSRTYGAAVSYTYEVDGKTYESDQIQLGGSVETSRPKQFERMVAKYPAGKQVTVYYDPDDPATATLEPGGLEGVFNLAMVGGGAVLVGTIVMVMTYIGR